MVAIEASPPPPDHLDAWSEAVIDAGSYPQRIAGIYNVGGGRLSLLAWAGTPNHSEQVRDEGRDSRSWPRRTSCARPPALPHRPGHPDRATQRGATAMTSSGGTGCNCLELAEPHRLSSVRLCLKRESAAGPETRFSSRTRCSLLREHPCVRGAGGNRTRVLRRCSRASPGAASDVVFSAPALALTRRRQAQPQKSPDESSWPGLTSKPPR
jgi:hypothetical protein